MRPGRSTTFKPQLNEGGDAVAVRHIAGIGVDKEAALSWERNREGLLMKAHLKSGLLATASCAALVGFVAGASANDKLIELSKSDENWVMPGKNYNSNNYSPHDSKINTDNVKKLQAAWSFSTGSAARSRRHAARRQRRDVRPHVVPEQHLRARPERPRPDPVAAQAEAGSGRSLGRLLRSRQPRSGLLARRRQDAAAHHQELSSTATSWRSTPRPAKSSGRSRTPTSRSARR